MKYNVDTDQLIRSDVEEIRGESEPKSIETGSQKALILEFTLPSSSYATMALREIMKCDTSVANQVQLQQSSAKNEVRTFKDATEVNEVKDATDAKQPKLDISCQ